MSASPMEPGCMDKANTASPTSFTLTMSFYTTIRLARLVNQFRHRLKQRVGQAGNIKSKKFPQRLRIQADADLQRLLRAKRPTKTKSCISSKYRDVERQRRLVEAIANHKHLCKLSTNMLKAANNDALFLRYDAAADVEVLCLDFMDACTLLDFVELLAARLDAVDVQGCGGFRQHRKQIPFGGNPKQKPCEFDVKAMANLRHMLQCVRQVLEAFVQRCLVWKCRCGVEQAEQNWKGYRRREDELNDNITEWPEGRRPLSSTMPWNIRPALVVLWGVCWMFIPNTGPYMPDGHSGNRNRPLPYFGATANGVDWPHITDPDSLPNRHQPRVEPFAQPNPAWNAVQFSHSPTIDPTNNNNNNTNNNALLWNIDDNMLHIPLQAASSAAAPFSQTGINEMTGPMSTVTGDDANFIAPPPSGALTRHSAGGRPGNFNNYGSSDIGGTPRTPDEGEEVCGDLCYHQHNNNTLTSSSSVSSSSSAVQAQSFWQNLLVLPHTRQPGIVSSVDGRPQSYGQLSTILRPSASTLSTTPHLMIQPPNAPIPQDLSPAGVWGIKGFPVERIGNPAMTVMGAAEAQSMEYPTPASPVSQGRGPSRRESSATTVDDDMSHDAPSIVEKQQRQIISHRRTEQPPKREDGVIYCTHPDCQPNPPTFKRPCEWNKHMDKHDRPYKCMEPGCSKMLGFTYSGGLLRHMREVHKKDIGSKIRLMCPFQDCNRSTGNGFTRRENLNEHLRRRHPNAPLDLSSSHGSISPQLPQAPPLQFPSPTKKRKRSEFEEPDDTSSETPSLVEDGTLKSELKRLKKDNELMKKTNLEQARKLKEFEGIIESLRQRLSKGTT